MKYDFGQLWKWKNILEQFALSDANTTGITFVRIMTNYHFPDGDNWIVPPLWVGGVHPVDYNEYEHWYALRNILMVAATDAYGTADALPHLLPLLGIPVDAVGLILWHDRRPTRLFVGKETADISTSSQNTVNETGQPPNVQPSGPQAPESPDGNEKNIEHSGDPEAGSTTSPPNQQSISAIQPPKQESDNTPAPQNNISETSLDKPDTGQLKGSTAAVRAPSGTAEEIRPESQERGNSAAPSETGPAGWTIIAIAGLAGLAALALVIFMGVRIARRRS